MYKNNKWINRKNYDINKIYEEVFKNIDLYNVFKYIEKRKQMWGESIFKHEKDGEEKYINYNIKCIKNKHTDNYTIMLLCLYFYISLQGIHNNINDIEIIEKMHDVTINVKIYHQKYSEKDIIKFSELKIQDKYFYQICYSAVIENIYNNKYFKREEKSDNSLNISNDSEKEDEDSELSDN